MGSFVTLDLKLLSNLLEACHNCIAGKPAQVHISYAAASKPRGNVEFPIELICCGEYINTEGAIFWHSQEITPDSIRNKHSTMAADDLNQFNFDTVNEYCDEVQVDFMEAAMEPVLRKEFLNSNEVVNDNRLDPNTVLRRELLNSNEVVHDNRLDPNTVLRRELLNSNEVVHDNRVDSNTVIKKHKQDVLYNFSDIAIETKTGGKLRNKNTIGEANELFSDKGINCSFIRDELGHPLLQKLDTIGTNRIETNDTLMNLFNNVENNERFCDDEFEKILVKCEEACSYDFHEETEVEVIDIDPLHVNSENMDKSKNFMCNNEGKRLDKNHSNSNFSHERKGAVRKKITSILSKKDKLVLNNKDNFKRKKYPDSLICEFCGKIFTGKDRAYFFSYHRNREHTNDIIFNCDVCCKQFWGDREFVAHMSCHNNPGHICHVCGHKFNAKKNLTVHLLTHSVAKEQVCNYCEKTFRRRDHLKVHERTHTGEKPYKCLFCLSGYPQKHQLTLHLVKCKLKNKCLELS